MATLQELKKKLRGIRSTEKLTKAMKTVSGAKHSKLNRLFGSYSNYADNCISLYKSYESEINGYLPEASASAPSALFVFSSNKGMCGGFNAEIFSFALEKIKELPESTLIFPCGKKAIAFFTERKIPFEKGFVFSDTPSSSEAQEFLNEILRQRENGKISSIYMIYPEYKNVMTQLPVMTELFSVKCSSENGTDEDTLFIPDKETVMKTVSDKIIFSAVYGIIIETALGAQASTLTTMRSAYDTAVSYSAMLETQINRKRQSEVTADVIETSR